MIYSNDKRSLCMRQYDNICLLWYS